MTAGQRVQTIDDYIKARPPAVRKRLAELRTTIRAAAPDAIEKVSYQMPTFYQRDKTSTARLERDAVIAAIGTPG